MTFKQLRFKALEVTLYLMS